MSRMSGRILRTSGVLALGAVLQGCSAAVQSPVPVVAERSDMTALVGDWSGEYSSPESGRSGSIVFRLKSTSDTAYGDVVMLPRAAVTGTAGDESGSTPGQAATRSQVLTIRFVRVEGSHLIGRMDPYIDPVCGCRLTTVFTGDFKGDRTIEGTYQTTGSEISHALTSGKWKVTKNGKTS